jgi:hypothetical protein
MFDTIYLIITVTYQKQKKKNKYPFIILVYFTKTIKKNINEAYVGQRT